MKRISNLLGLYIDKYIAFEKKVKDSVDVVVLYIEVYVLIAMIAILYTGKESEINILNEKIDSIEIANNLESIKYQATIDSQHSEIKTLRRQLDSLKSIPVTNKVVYPFIVGNEMDVNMLNDFITSYKVKAYRANGRKFNHIKVHFELNFPQ